jgi:hypothetical protein
LFFFNEGDVIELIQACWSDKDALRPEFEEIKVRLTAIIAASTAAAASSSSSSSVRKLFNIFLK